MDTQVRTPQLVFMQPQRLIVPLFQRPYVWNEENQWDPLWRDVLRVTERLLTEQDVKPQPHFLGAVVLQQMPNSIGSLQVRTVIDGQQRLTTLQLLLDALHAELLAVGAQQSAMRLEALVTNPPAFCELEEDQFKVWPTNRDRAAFNDVMGAEPPVMYESLNHRDARLVRAHQFFAEQARMWLQQDGPEDVLARSEKLEHAVRELLQLVVIDLNVDENAQEIFETLNARGAQLTAADLIKNFIFQRLVEEGVDVEVAYEENWKDFETGFWETEVNFGRLRYSRSSIFLNHLLISRTGQEIVAREVFSRFKTFADFDVNVPMAALLQQLARASGVYRRFVDGATASNPIDRLQLFAYRTSTLESEVFKPVILWILDPELVPISDHQVAKTLEVIESWLVRRMLTRGQTKGYNQTAAELVAHLRKGDRNTAGDLAEAFLATQTASSRYWPDDKEVSRELATLPAYLRLRRGRLRMVLEAVEDFRRGWRDGAEGLGGERVARGKYHIEHVMPKSWKEHWPLMSSAPDERDRTVHSIGNLTLLTSKLNSKVSNSAWETKRTELQKHDVLKMNSILLASAVDSWTDAKIRTRTQEMTEAILTIWPVPEGHASPFGGTTEYPKQHVTLADLIGAGLLEPGATLFARNTHNHHRATVLSDGRIDVGGEVFESPSGAAKAVTGKGTNGWWFWRLDANGNRSLNNLYHDYVDQTAADVDEDGSDGDEDEGDDA